MGDKSCPLCVSGVPHVHDLIQTVHDTEVVTVQASDTDKLISDLDNEWDAVHGAKWTPVGAWDDVGGWDDPIDPPTMKGLKAKAAKNKAKKMDAIVKELKKTAMDTNMSVVILNQTDKHYSHFVADDVVSTKNVALNYGAQEAKAAKALSSLLGGPSASNTKFNVPKGTGKALTVSAIQTAITNMQKASAASSYFDNEYVAVDDVDDDFKKPDKLVSPDTDMAQNYMNFCGIGVTVLNGHKLENILVAYAAHQNNQLQTRLEDMVRERVQKELTKNHRRDCIPTFRKNDRKFR